ncbi:MAG: SDR family NAD(P)-dependent oxidoreductase, partial [Halobacteriales archaeon]
RVLDVLPDDVDYLYASSTGVYGPGDGSWVDEETPLEADTGWREVMVDAERLASDAGGTVVRFAGLYGPGRLSPDRYLDGATVKSGYLNLLHRDDAASAAVAALDGERSLYVAVDDEPVHRHDLSRWLAEQTGREVGELVDETARSNRRCSNRRLRSEGWRPVYPSYREGFVDALDLPV